MKANPTPTKMKPATTPMNLTCSAVNAAATAAAQAPQSPPKYVYVAMRNDEGQLPPCPPPGAHGEWYTYVDAGANEKYTLVINGTTYTVDGDDLVIYGCPKPTT